MPIHDQGYRRYAGSKAATGRSWAVIASAGIRTFFGKKAFLGLLLLGWLPFLVRAIQVFLSATYPQMRILALTPVTYYEMLDSGPVSILVFIVTVYVGAGLIANDRRANALHIYLSKPLTRAEYVFGKLAILVAFLLLITWVPAMVLLLVQIAFAGNFTFLRDNLFLFPAITVFAFVEVAMVSTAMLALSSLSNSSRYVGILYAALIFFSQALYGVLTFVTGGSAISWVSLPADLTQVGYAIFRLPPRYETPVVVSFLMIAALVGLSALILEKRVRGVEVVA